MSKPKYTPGPWVVEQLGHYHKQLSVHQVGRTDSARHVCTIYGEKGAVGHFKEMSERQLADARLIAAAPELLEALSRVVQLARLQCANPSCDCVQCRLVAEAHAAIAKAEGRDE